MKNTVVIIFILSFLSFCIACQGQEESQLPDYLIINNSNYRQNIELVRQGWSAQNPLTAKEHLEHLLIFIQDPSIKKKHYKNDAGAWVYDVAMIQLMRAEYLSSFRTFKEYMEITSEDVQPFFQIGWALNYLHEHSGKKALELCLENLVNRRDMSILSNENTLQLLQEIHAKYLIFTANRNLEQKILDSQEYKRANILYETGNANYKKNPYDSVLNPGAYELVEQNLIDSIESKKKLSELEIDFLIRYYANLLTANYEKAAFYADKKDWDNLGGYYPEYIMSRMMIAYNKMGRYDDTIALFKQNEKNLRERHISEDYIYLWVGAAYAGLDDYENAKKYLELALEVTTLEDGYHVSYDEKGSVLFVIFNLVFFTDEYDRFEEIGRYDEIERIVENSMTRFKHLRLFQ